MTNPNINLKCKIYRHKRQKYPFFLRWFYIVSPYAATGELWDRQKRMAKHRHPVRYWLQETYPRYIGRTKHAIGNAIWTLRKHTVNDDRWMHIGTLPAGYSEPFEKLLHVSFRVFSDFVENEFESHLRASPKRLVSTNRDRIVDTLAAFDELMADEDYKCVAEQYENMLRLRRLYIWWKIERNQRIEVFSDDRIWGDVHIDESKDLLFAFGRTRSEAERQASKHVGKTKRFYEEQDSAMMAELVKIRLALWS